MAIVDWNLRLHIVLVGAAKRTGLFGANWRSTAIPIYMLLGISTNLGARYDCGKLTRRFQG